MEKFNLKQIQSDVEVARKKIEASIFSGDILKMSKEEYDNLCKQAGRKKIKDRGINWKEKYHEKSIGLKKKFDKEIGPKAYMRFEGHDYTTNSDYFVVVGPAVTKDLKKRYFAGVKKLPDDPKAKIYAPSGEYFSTVVAAYSHASDKWGIPFPKGVPEYNLSHLANIDIPRHVKG